MNFGIRPRLVVEAKRGQLALPGVVRGLGVLPLDFAGWHDEDIDP